MTDHAVDVCIVGSGAGGAMLARELAIQGVRVALVEEGGHWTRRDFDGREDRAFPRLFQDRGLRATQDGAITILQGRAVGGGTTVNWTTCFRTPDRVLEHWGRQYGLDSLSPVDLRPHFEEVESRLGIEEWPEAVANANNQVLLRGCRALGWQAAPTRRNVRGCRNSGLCTTGCPYDAKQSMLVSAVPEALEHGALLLSRARVRRVLAEGTRATGVEGVLLDAEADRETGETFSVRAKVVVAACGAINSPALLLRSGLGRQDLLGRGTFLHPVVAVPALYPEPVLGFYGAPQSAASHHFVDRGEADVGFFIEASPVHPMLASTAMTWFGGDQARFMKELPRIGALIALHVEGFHEAAPGGRVTLRPDGRPALDYPVSSGLARAFRDAHVALGRIALAAGALQAQTLHPTPLVVRRDDEFEAFEWARFGAHEHTIFSAHQMGGCAMGADPERSVVDPQHRLRGMDNLFVVDGSVFPTALGVNPSETIYALALHAAPHVLAALGP